MSCRMAYRIILYISRQKKAAPRRAGCRNDSNQSGVQHLLGNLLAGQAIFYQQIGRLAALAEHIADANLPELLQTHASQGGGHGVAQAADDGVLFHGEHLAALGRIGAGQIIVKGLQRMEAHQSGVDTLVG